jgi:hypothetical protein
VFQFAVEERDGLVADQHVHLCSPSGKAMWVRVMSAFSG